jgi:hypothetical protein
MAGSVLPFPAYQTQDGPGFWPRGPANQGRGCTHTGAGWTWNPQWNVDTHSGCSCVAEGVGRLMPVVAVTCPYLMPSVCPGAFSEGLWHCMASTKFRHAPMPS